MVAVLPPFLFLPVFLVPLPPVVGVVPLVAEEAVWPLFALPVFPLPLPGVVVLFPFDPFGVEVKVVAVIPPVVVPLVPVLELPVFVVVVPVFVLPVFAVVPVPVGVIPSSCSMIAMKPPPPTALLPA